MHQYQFGTIIDNRGGVVYDDLSDLSQDTIDRLVQLLNEDDSRGWDEMAVILERERLRGALDRVVFLIDEGPNSFASDEEAATWTKATWDQCRAALQPHPHQPGNIVASIDVPGSPFD